MLITSSDVHILDDMMQKLIAKVQLLGFDSKKLDDVCYDILYQAEKAEEECRGKK